MTALGARVRAPDALIVTGAAAAIALCAFATAVGASGRVLVVLAAIALVPWALVVVPHLRRLLLIGVVLDVVLQWDVNFGYRAEAGELGAEAGLNLSLTTVALAGLYANWAVERCRPLSGAPPFVLRSASPLIGYVAVSATSILVAGDPALGGYYLALLLQTLLLFVYIASTVRSRSDVVLLFTALMAALVLEGSLIVLQHVTGQTFSLLGLNADASPSDLAGFGASREAGTLGSPNTAASVIALLLPAALGLLLAPVDRSVRRLALAALAVGVPALVLTGSRGGWLTFFLSCSIVAAVTLRRRVVAPRAAVRLAFGIAVLLLPLAGFVAQRLNEADPASARSRLPLARLAVDMIEDNPVLGVGLNNTVLRIPDYAGPDYTQDWLYVVHNKYLLVASEAGLLALAAFVWFLVKTVQCALRCLRSGDLLIAPLALSLLAGLLGSMILMSAEIFSGRAQVQGLLLIAGMLTAMAALTVQRDPARSPHVRA